MYYLQLRSSYLDRTTFCRIRQKRTKTSLYFVGDDVKSNWPLNKVILFILCGFHSIFISVILCDFFVEVSWLFQKGNLSITSTFVQTIVFKTNHLLHPELHQIFNYLIQQTNHPHIKLKLFQKSLHFQFYLNVVKL